MRINNLYNENLDDKEYKIEVRANINLMVDGYELAKDWIDPELYEELEILMKDCIVNSIVNNRNPYFYHKNPDEYYERKIRGVLNQLSYADMSNRNLLKRAVKSTKLSEERCIELMNKIRPDLNFRT